MGETKVRKNLRRKRAHAIREGRAVSPVVATLILILVAVAAAAALYLWLVAWQGNITGSIGTPTPQSTVTIGGSTSVYPFDQVAVKQFEENNSNIIVSNNQGGTGAGMIAVCHGAVDIGASSSLQTLNGLQTNDQCPSTTVINTVAYDAVDPILPVANPHGIVSINESVLLGIYLVQSTTTPTTTMPAYLAASGWTASANNLVWKDIPQHANCLTAGQLLPPGGTGGGCTFDASVTSANAVQTVHRSDTSGTEQTFTAKLLGIAGTQPVTSYAALANNFGGCGSDGQLASCGITPTFGENGNPAVIAQVASHPDSIGFASDGLARATGSGVTCSGSGLGVCLGYAGVGQTAAVVPSLGSSGTIATAIKDPSGTGTVALTGEYAGWRPFEWVTTNTPTGEVQRLLQYVMDPANNINFAAESAEISVYSV
ncbi:MAG TPA: substrate-binding domain-containing protein [Thermoplasmata archaeon]|nr:substrate-binding domain-containing protein [Thermoplasmata archaeon]